MVDTINKITLSHSEISLRADGIVEIQFVKNSEIDWKACEELTTAYDQLLENKKYPLLHLTGDYVTFTADARKFSVTERGLQYSKAEAYVFTSLAHKILANFYMKVNKPPVPTKFFRTKEEAEEWLSKFL